MSLVPHHDGSARHVSDLAPTLGAGVSVWVRVPEDAGVARVYARTTPDAEPRFTEASLDRRTVGEQWWRAEIRVINPVTNYRFLLIDRNGGHRWLNALGTFDHDVPDDTDFRLVAHGEPPPWSGDAVIYEIFPDRFARSAAAARHPLPEWAIACDWDTPVIGRGPQTPYQFYGGDLDGIVEHLDHIEALGANTVYLTPIFPARSNHRYDAASFDHIDPLVGGDEALHRLAKAVQARGMRLIGDITTNHTGDSHPWFQAARAGGVEREMFYFDAQGEYESWCGVSTLPKLNWRSAELRRRFFAGPDSVTARWLDDFDGWRVDVANMTGRRGADDHTREVARLMRAAVDQARPDAMLVAEHAHDATADLDQGGWQGTMNYPGFLRPLWTWLRHDQLDLPDLLGVPGGVPRRGARAMVATMRQFAARRSWQALAHSWNLLGSHDSARIRTIVGDPARVEVAVGLLLTLPGVPMIFAGDEIGLTGVNGEDARRTMPWHRPDSWDHSTLDVYRRLIALRRASTALRHGGLRWLHADDESLAFLRDSDEETLLVYARRGTDPTGGPVRLTGIAATSAENIHGGAALPGPISPGPILLPPDGPTLQIWRLH